MWIALLDVCLFLLLVSFLLYGLGEWDNLLAEPEDGTAEEPVSREPPGRKIALWILVVGLGGVSILYEFLEWLKS